MFKSIQQKLRDVSILDKDEPILAFVRVVDYLKHQQLFKKILKEELASVLPANKIYYLLVTSMPIDFLLTIFSKFSIKILKHKS